VISKALAKVALSDLLAIGGISSVVYGLAILHPAAAWIGAGVLAGWLSIELGRREAGRRQE
jgi:hypothetical protein